jgi:hypothetical protein
MRAADRLVVLLVVLAGCALQGAAPAPTVALPHDAYVWQRRWTPAVEEAVSQSAAHVRRWRVLGAEMSGGGELVAVQADRRALGRMPVVLVVRINDQIPRWDHERAVTETVALVERWRDGGATLAGLEIDHDCGTARLGDYADFLARVRRAVSPDLELSITALPAWLASSRLDAVLAQVDETVLQVHAVVNPRQGLFDRAQAAAWVRRWGRVSPTPFRVALPTYGSRVTWDRAGRVTAVESEMPRYANLAPGRELVVRPLEVARFIDEVRRSSVPNLAGFAWFRVPTAGDRRAWTLATWHAVMAGHAIPPVMRAATTRGEVPGLFDVHIVNEGPIDDVVPRRVWVDDDARCEAADGVAPYTAARGADGVITFSLQAPLLLAAGERRPVGWVRCARAEGLVHVER